MEEKIFMLLKVSIRTTYEQLHEAIKELQTSDAEITSTKNVKMLRSEIVPMNTPKR